MTVTAAKLTAITPDTGVAGDFVTNATKLTFSGTDADSGASQLGIWISGGSFGSTPVLLGTVSLNAGQTSWSFKYNKMLSDGTYTVSMTNGTSGTAVLSTQTITIDTTGPTITSIADSGAGITNGSGDLNAGHVITFTVQFSGNVTVDTSGGTPILRLNDGGVATYTGGSGTSALTFSYTVLAGQNTSDLAVSGLNLNKATIQDFVGNAANVSAANNYALAGTLIIDTTPPTVSSVAVTQIDGASGNSGDLNAGHVVTLAVTFNAPVTVNTTAGSPFLSLNDTGTAAYVGGSGTNTLTFSYTVGAGQNTPDLTVTGLVPNGATIQDAANNNANVSGAAAKLAGTLIIDTTPPTVSSVAVTRIDGAAGNSGDLNAGHVVTLAVTFSEAVRVNTTAGSPFLSLNDTGTAAYVGGSGTNTLTFSYTVGAGQNTPDLTVTGLVPNGATIRDGAGNDANLAGAAANPAGTLMIDTTAPGAPTITDSADQGGVVNLVNDTAAQALSGTAEAGSTIKVYLNGAATPAYTTTADASGNWSVTIGVLAAGSYSYTATATDAAGNTGLASAALSFTATPTTINSALVGPIVLQPANNPLTITATGTVQSTGSAVDAIDGSAGTTWTVANAGLIASSGGFGMQLLGPGVVTNSGSITGVDALVLRVGGSVTNVSGGSISGFGALGSGGGSGSGVYIPGAAGTVANSGTISGAAYGVSLGDGGIVTNSASILGGEDGVIVQGAIGTVTNTGTVTATVDDSISLFAGGTVTNAAGATVAAFDTIGSDVFITGGPGTVSNSGSMTGGREGVFFTAGGSIANAGSITSQVFGVFASNAAVILTNSGSISATATGGSGADIEAGGSISNNAGGAISGDAFGVFMTGGASTVTNAGSITGFHAVGLEAGGSVANQTGGSITGQSAGIFFAGGPGSVDNAGSIVATVDSGVDAEVGGSVNNEGGATISGNAFGVFMTGGLGTATNAGTITGAHGVGLSAGGSVDNAVSGSINASFTGVLFGNGFGSVVNSGAITGAGDSGVDAELGASVTNNAGGSIAGSAFGVFVTGGQGIVTNAGSMSGADGVGLNAGGSVVNNVGATITGTNVGIFASGGLATITNAAAISATGAGSTGVDVEGGGTIANDPGASISGSTFGVFLSGGGTVANAGMISGGSYAVDFASSPTNRLIVQPGATFPGGVNGGGGSLELASGAGAIAGIDSGPFNNFQTLAVDSGAAWTLNGANAIPTLVDNGTLAIAGSLSISGSVDPTSTGSFQLGTSATLEVAADVGTLTSVSFLSGGQLIVDQAASFGTNVGTTSYAGPQLQNFAAGASVDLKNFSLAGTTLNYDSSTGILQLANSANQVASLSFQTTSLGSGTFQVAPDTTNGVLLTHT